MESCGEGISCEQDELRKKDFLSSLKNIGIAGIVLSSTTILSTIVLLISHEYLAPGREIGAGIWCNVFALSSSCCLIYAAKHQKPSVVLLSSCLCSVAAIFDIALVIIEFAFAMSHGLYGGPWPEKVMCLLHLCMVALTLPLMTLMLYSSVIMCRICCSTNYHLSCDYCYQCCFPFPRHRQGFYPGVYYGTLSSRAQTQNVQDQIRNEI